MSARHPGGQWVNGCTNPADPHEIGDCGGPAYSDGATEQARVDAVMGDALTDTEALARVIYEASDSYDEDGVEWENQYGAAKRQARAQAAAVAVRTSAAVKQAQADERERIAQAIEAVLTNDPGVAEDLKYAARIARGADL